MWFELRLSCQFVHNTNGFQTGFAVIPLSSDRIRRLLAVSATINWISAVRPQLTG